MLSFIDGLLNDTRYVYDDELVTGPILMVLVPAIERETGGVFEEAVRIVVKVTQSPLFLSC